MKYIILLLLFICSKTFSQVNYLDKLKAELETKEDTKSYLYDLLTSEKQADKLAVINNALGLQFQRENNLDSAFYYHKKALYSAFKEGNDNQEIGVSYNKLGIIYFYRGELDSAIIFFEKSIPYYKEKSLKANSINNLAIMNKYNSRPDFAIKYYLVAYDIYKEIQDTSKQIFVLSNIGALFSDLSHFNRAEKYLKNGQKLAELSHNKDGEISCKSNLAKTYVEKAEYDKAIPLLNEANAYYSSIEKYQYLIVNKNNLASCYDEIGKKKEGLMVYHETLKLMEATGIESNKESVLLNIGSSYEDLGLYEKSLNYSVRALVFAKENNLVLRYEPIYKNLSAVYQKMNNIDSSLYYKDLQIALRDSLDNIERENKMMELDAKYQNKKLNSDLLFTQSELDKTKKQKAMLSKSLTYSLTVFLIAAFGMYIFYCRYKKKKLLSEDLLVKNKEGIANIEDLESTLDFKNEEIDKLSYLKQKGKLEYPKYLVTLTKREQEVLFGVQEGLKDQEIADKLFISIATVRTHLRKAYSKIDARNRAEAIQFISTFEI